MFLLIRKIVTRCFVAVCLFALIVAGKVAVYTIFASMEHAKTSNQLRPG
jgi:hypothetical protein